jgi:hypothetical protein
MSELNMMRCDPPLALFGHWLTPRNHFTLAAQGLNFGFCGGTKCIRTNDQLPRQFSIAQNLYAVTIAIDKPALPQPRLIHPRPIVKGVQGPNVHGQISRGKARIVKSALGNPADERHLAAFKANTNGTAGARGLTFATTAGGFAMTAGFTLTEAFATMLRAGTGFKIV